MARAETYRAMGYQYVHGYVMTHCAFFSLLFLLIA